MTKSQQIGFYFPAWRKACVQNDWHDFKGCFLGVRDPQWGHGEANRVYNAVWDAAQAIAEANHRAILATDMRHACHVVALGRDISSHQMNSRQTNRVVRLFQILKNPNSIDAMNAWLDPEYDDRRALVRWINDMAGNADAYVCKMAEMFSAFHSPHWEDLPIDNLRSLARLLKKRTEDRHAPITENATADVLPEQKPIDLSKLRTV